ncbi:helix-turn-helix domain-containing protein [Duganella sp. LX20W]|uniref:Helix-turn-helix domain-containing protein n=1 Tax=Rugamonas brunnea TaxID=2758569 RepID=A0A7W2ETI0_9BURK|nr:helix-turn-helix domain-containing protein [Rugamonas brunnea]MBA5638270.1 helix-turn-helix domain-containing protein [Rugamonas brunnea]
MTILTSPATRNGEETNDTCVACKNRDACLPMTDDRRAPIPQLIRRRHRVLRGETLFMAGDQTDNSYFVVRCGSMMSVRVDSMGRKNINRFLMSGDYAGLESIGFKRHGCTVVALEDTEVCEIACRHDPAQIARLYERFGKLLAEEQVNGLSLYHTLAIQRVAAFLINLSARFRERGYSASCFRLTMERKHIAQFLGLTAESVSRQLSQLRDTGVIAVDGRVVTLRDTVALGRVANGAPARALAH